MNHFHDICPFTAIVGQEQMKKALVLNAINPRIGGVLIKGEKGTAKSTAARALAQDPKLYLFDEPTSALDIRYQIEVMETMREITGERGAGMIIAVHDLNLAYRYADTVVVLHGGKMAGYGKPQEILTPECIRKVYGVDAFVIENEQGKFLVPFRAGSAP